MVLIRSNILGWAAYETFTAAQANTIDSQIPSALDGTSGGTYNPSAALIINNQIEINSTGAAAANVIGLVVTGKGTEAGIETTGGATSGEGVIGTGGAPNGTGVAGYGTGSGSGIDGFAASAAAFGVAGFGNGNTAPTGVYTNCGVLGVGASAGGHGVIGEGVGTGEGVIGYGGVAGGGGQGGQFYGGGTAGAGIGAYGSGTTAFVLSVGVLSQVGIAAIGGSTGGIGVVGEGTVGSAGVHGQGSNGGGQGVNGIGGDTSGQGVRGTGGTGGGIGVAGYGDSTGTGVYGEGGTSDAWGGHFVGGATNGGGVFARSRGTGTAVSTFRDAAGSNLRLEGEATDPTGPAEGDIWADSADAELIAYFASRKHQLLDTWASVSISAIGAVSVGNQNNVSSVTVSGVSNDVTVNFARSFTDTNYAVVVTIGCAPVSPVIYFVVGSTKATGSFKFQIRDHAGALIDPSAAGTDFYFGIVVKGCL